MTVGQIISLERLGKIRKDTMVVTTDSLIKILTDHHQELVALRKEVDALRTAHAATAQQANRAASFTNVIGPGFIQPDVDQLVPDFLEKLRDARS